jgi:hypothetical protein
LRSTFPFGVSGSTSSITNTDGTMYSGSFSLNPRRNSEPRIAISVFVDELRVRRYYISYELLLTRFIFARYAHTLTHTTLRH